MANINELLARAKKNAADELANTIERHKRHLTEKLQNIERAYLARHLLSAAGFSVGLPNDIYDADELNLRVEQTELTKVRAALGCPLKYDGKELHDETKRLVRVQFRPEYLTKIPRRKKGAPPPKCQIKKVRQKAYTYATLMCEVH